jgi:hypothetical protein
VDHVGGTFLFGVQKEYTVGFGNKEEAKVAVPTKTDSEARSVDFVCHVRMLVGPQAGVFFPAEVGLPGVKIQPDVPKSG